MITTLFLDSAEPMSFQETLDRLKKQDLNEERLDKKTEEWKKILEQRAAEEGSNTTGKGETPKRLWDVVIEAYIEPPKPIHPKKNSVFIAFISEIRKSARKIVYSIVENPQFGLFVAGNFFCIHSF